MPTFKILYSAQNTNGRYLEVALADIKDDLVTKNSLIGHLTDPVSVMYQSSNQRIIELLEEAVAIQESAIAFSNAQSEEKTYLNVNGITVHAYPMSWHDYLKFLGRKVHGDGMDGYLVTTDKGTINHNTHWFTTEHFNRVYTKA